MAPRFQPIVIDPDKLLEHLDQIEVKRQDHEDLERLSKVFREERLSKVLRAAESAREQAELALRLVGRVPPPR